MEKRDTSNGMACLDKIFQKFECIYHDVDGLVKQAESQLLTVGANVKAFFSELDLMEDAASQYSEDENPRAAPDTSVLQKTDDAVNIKSLMGSDGGDEVHLGSVESVKSVSSCLSLEHIDDDNEKKWFLLQTPDKIDSSNANHEVGLDIGVKMLIPAPDDVGECKSLMQTEDRSTDLVHTSSTISNDKKDLSDANEEIRLDSGVKLLLPASDDIREYNSFMDTEEKSTDLVDMSSEVLNETRLSDAFEMDNLCKKSTKGSLKKVELGESCILVDTSELERSYAEAAKGKSYKKKLKDAFVSKMRLLKKHNNDEQKNSFSVLSLPEKSNSPDCHEFCECDWEIVQMRVSSLFT